MSLDELYDAMKDALVFFGLRWGQKDQVQVHLNAKGLLFVCDHRSVQIDLTK